MIRFRAPRRTYWIEHPDGGGHWASNWEIAIAGCEQPLGEARS